LPIPPSPAEYLPRILGSGLSADRDVTELVIVGLDQIEALSRMLDLFRDHKVELFGLESQSLPDTKHFVITAYAGLRSSDCSLETLLGLIRDLLSVQSAKGSELKGSRYEKFLFPIVALDGSRLVITKTETLTEVESHFSKLSEEKGCLVLFATGRQSGLALIRELRRFHQSQTQRDMLVSAEDELRTGGWGLATFDVSQMEEGTVGVVVKDPIMVNSPRARESWLTYGLCAGLIEGIYGMVGHVGKERSFSAGAKELKFKLVELTADQKIQGMGR